MGGLKTATRLEGCPIKTISTLRAKASIAPWLKHLREENGFSNVMPLSHASITPPERKHGEAVLVRFLPFVTGRTISASQNLGETNDTPCPLHWD